MKKAGTTAPPGVRKDLMKTQVRQSQRSHRQPWPRCVRATRRGKRLEDSFIEVRFVGFSWGGKYGHVERRPRAKQCPTWMAWGEAGTVSD
jgi:hypothetical protein